MNLVLREGTLQLVLPNCVVVNDLVLMDGFDLSIGNKLLHLVKSTFLTLRFQYQPTWNEDNSSLPERYQLLPVVYLSRRNNKPEMFVATQLRLAPRILMVKKDVATPTVILESKF